MAEKKIVGVRYSEEVNADLFIDTATNQLTKAVNNVNGQEIGSGGGDFSTAKLTIVGEEFIQCGRAVDDFEIKSGKIVSGSYGLATVGDNTIILYKGKAYLAPSKRADSFSGNVTEFAGDYGDYWYEMTGDCTLTFN